MPLIKRVRDVARPTKSQIARVLIAVLAVAVVIHAEVRGVTQGERITRVEHTKTVELCSTKVSCRRLLNELLKTVTPRDIAGLRKRVGVTIGERRSGTVAPLARKVARRNAAVPRVVPPVLPRAPEPVPAPRPVTTRPVSRPAPAPKSPAPVATTGQPPEPPKSAPPTPEPPTPKLPVPKLPVPTPEPPHIVEVPPGKEGPLGLPCVKVAGIEVLCHAAR